jgi:thioesterase domain-containing protein/non-ribosomal peptide synthetase component F
VPGRDSTELESIIGPFVNYLPVRVDCAPATQLSELLTSTSAMFAEWISHSEYRHADILQARNLTRDPFDALFISQRDFVRTVERGGLKLSALPSVSPGALYGITFFLVEREDGWRASCEVDTAKHSVEEAQDLLRKYQQILEAFAQDPEQTIGQVTAQLRDASIVSATAQTSTPQTEQVPYFVDFPASEAQSRYYWLDHSDPGRSTFHLRIRMAVDGELQLDRVTEAVDTLVRRHEVLRTTFVMVDDQLRQRVHEPTLPPSFEYLDLSSMTAAERDEQLRNSLLRENDWHFDLATGPLFRVFVADLGENRWILAMTMAHLLVDGWSSGILQTEFQKIYTALLNGDRPDLPELHVQYGDYSVGEERWLQSADVDQRVEFWRNNLSGKMAALDLPADNNSQHTSQANGEVEIATLDASLASSVRLLARDLETTPFVIYGAIFQALLFRYSRETDITFSTPLASRTEETESVLGPFSIPLLLRTRLQPEWSIRQYIHALHHVAMDAFDNPLPFERCADSVALSTVRGRHALNQFCFFYQKAFVEKSELKGIRFSPLPTAVTGAGFEWQLAIIERQGEGIAAELQYDADLYSKATIQTALRHYERLLSDALFHLDSPVSEITFATSEESAAAAHHADTLLPISRRALGIDLPHTPHHATESTAEGPAVLPRNEDEAAMTNLWQQAFRRSPISIHANFFDMGGHSLTLARLQALCQKQLGRRIHAADLFAAPTIASLTARLTGTDAAPVAFNPRLIPLQAEGTQSPLFLISQSMVFRRVAECLGPDQPVFTVKIEDEDLKGAENFEDFARLYVNIIRAFRPHGPYRIGGWCAAGWVAYEIAQQLRALGETVEMLMIVDAWAPGYWRDLPIGRKLVAKTNYYWARFHLHRRTLLELPFREQTDFFKERFRLWRASIIRQMGSIPFLRRVPRQVVADDDTTLVDQVQYAASLKYQPRPWPGTALLFRSSEQPAGKFLPNDMGWVHLLTEESDITLLPGDHRKIFDDPGAQIIAASVQAFLSGQSACIPLAAQTQKQAVAESEETMKSCALVGF